MNDDRSWRDYAACRGMNTDVFFVPVGGSIKEAQAVCAGCPAVAFNACFDDAVWRRDTLGVRAGTSVKERRDIRAGRRTQSEVENDLGRTH